MSEMFSARLQYIPAFCFSQVLFLHAGKRFVAHQSVSQNAGARVKGADPLFCKYHILISSLCSTTFKHVCIVSAAPSSPHLAADFQAACVNIF